jgi:hypothetical protein
MRAGSFLTGGLFLQHFVGDGANPLDARLLLFFEVRIVGQEIPFHPRVGIEIRLR